MTIQSTDQTEAADVIHYLIDSQAGVASATTQKLLTDDTTGESVAGALVDLALTDDEQAQFLSDADASLTAILAARASAVSATGVSSSATDASADSSAGTVAAAGTDSTDAAAPALS